MAFSIFERPLPIHGFSFSDIQEYIVKLNETHEGHGQSSALKESIAGSKLFKKNFIEEFRFSEPKEGFTMINCKVKAEQKNISYIICMTINTENEYPTIEDIYCALVNTDRGVKEKLRFYDTAGTVPGQSTDFLKTYMQYAEGVVLVYAINSRESFQLLDQVKKEYDKNKEKKEVPIIVLGNKMDLQNERQVDIVLAQAWAQKEKVKLYEVSAVDRRTLTDPFVYLASKMNPPPSKSSFPQLGKKGKPGSITMEL